MKLPFDLFLVCQNLHAPFIRHLDTLRVVCNRPYVESVPHMDMPLVDFILFYRVFISIPMKILFLTLFLGRLFFLEKNIYLLQSNPWECYLGDSSTVTWHFFGILPKYQGTMEHLLYLKRSNLFITSYHTNIDHIRNNLTTIFLTYTAFKCQAYV